MKSDTLNTKKSIYIAPTVAACGTVVAQTKDTSAGEVKQPWPYNESISWIYSAE